MRQLVIKTKESTYTLSVDFIETNFFKENKKSIYSSYFELWCNQINEINILNGCDVNLTEIPIQFIEEDLYSIKNYRGTSNKSHRGLNRTLFNSGFITEGITTPDSQPKPNSSSTISDSTPTYPNSEVSLLNNGRGTQQYINPILTGVSGQNFNNIYTLFPQLQNNKTSIKIPKKVELVLRRYVNTKLLKKVHKNKQVAIELCLIFLNKLNSTNFYSSDGSEDYEGEGWKPLHSHILCQEFTEESSLYKKIISALLCEGKNGALLQCDGKHQQGEKCFYYRLGDSYRHKGVITYEVKTPEALKVVQRNFERNILAALDNVICRNLLKFYPLIELPTIEEIIERAKELIKMGFITKKGKKLCSLNNRPRAYYKDAKERSFIEDSIKLFEYLTKDGLMIPHESGEKSGGRVIDSFTLMPSWIREMCKVNGVPIAEADYSALHPNIAMCLYGGGSKFIMHSDVSSETGINIKEVKKEHLSFFNKTWEQIMQSPLYNYYWLKEPGMMESLYRDKTEGEFFDINRYKMTSRRMFRKEVEIMTEVIRNLNAEGIYVGYVYDALFCHPDQKQRVQDVMNDVILQHGVKTRAK